MKEFSKDNIIINKNIDNIFDLLYNDNKDVLSLFNIVKYESQDWKDNVKIDIITLIIDDMPDILSQNFLNNTKEITIKCKNTITKKDENELIVITKFKLINKSKLIKFVNLFKILQFSNTVKLYKIEDNYTNLCVKTKIKTYIIPPFKEVLETFSLAFSQNYLDNVINKLTS